MKEKGNKLYVKWKGDKQKPKTLGANVKVKLDLSSNATKVEIKKNNKCWYIRFCQNDWFS